MLELLGRSKALFCKDISAKESLLLEEIGRSRFLILGGAGTIGKAVTVELFKRNPKLLHVVDISENNLVELVRDIRSSHGYSEGEFKTFSLDIGSEEYDAFIEAGQQYEYVLNLAALKHVRSEKDPFTLMRLVNVNVLNTEKTIQQTIKMGARKYFAVSTDKATNPVNMMGASKRIMEMCLVHNSDKIAVSTARFANVAFSDGSLLYGLEKRFAKSQPIVAPRDVKRYFMTPKEAGELCLLSCILGENRDVFFPKLGDELYLESFEKITRRYLEAKGCNVIECSTESQARTLARTLNRKEGWPCFFTQTNTTGEKVFEEFYSDTELVDFSQFQAIGVVKLKPEFNRENIERFIHEINALKIKKRWKKGDIVNIFKKTVSDFEHDEKEKYLDDKM